VIHLSSESCRKGITMRAPPGIQGKGIQPRGLARQLSEANSHSPMLSKRQGAETSCPGRAFPQPRLRLETCLDGEVDCDQTQLSAGEKQQVADANHESNLQNCLEGLSMCDRTQLTQQEQQDVSRAIHDRNLSECIDGYGICDFAQLTPAEK
jgi:hypothetical protein